MSFLRVWPADAADAERQLRRAAADGARLPLSLLLGLPALFAGRSRAQSLEFDLFPDGSVETARVLVGRRTPPALARRLEALGFGLGSRNVWYWEPDR